MYPFLGIAVNLHSVLRTNTVYVRFLTTYAVFDKVLVLLTAENGGEAVLAINAGEAGEGENALKMLSIVPLCQRFHG